jgi:hypothetical protein
LASDDYISVRDWRHKPPLRLRVTRKLHVHWCWIKCTRCDHMAAVAIVPYIIRWGPDAWQEMLRQVARCTECGQRGVALQHPSWVGSDTGWSPMPGTRIAAVPHE